MRLLYMHHTMDNPVEGTESQAKKGVYINAAVALSSNVAIQFHLCKESLIQSVKNDKYPENPNRRRVSVGVPELTPLFPPSPPVSVQFSSFGNLWHY